MHGRNYAKFAEKAGINYTVYYTDYPDMTAADKGDKRFEVPGKDGAIVFNYRSSHDWVNQPGVQNVMRASGDEYLLYHCLAFRMHCNLAPEPTRSSMLLV